MPIFFHRRDIQLAGLWPLIKRIAIFRKDLISNTRLHSFLYFIPLWGVVQVPGSMFPYHIQLIPSFPSIRV